MRALYILLIVFLFLARAASAAEFDDWIISETCSKDANKLCHGYYRQPIFPQVIGTGPQAIQITSDEASLVAKGTSVFTGNVKAIQGDKIIYADEAIVVHNSETGDLETITVNGNVQMMQPGMRVDGTQAIAYVGEERKTVDNAVYRLYDRHARGTADSVEIFGNNKMVLCDATYTTCAPNNNEWIIRAQKTKFNKITGRGEAWHGLLYLKGMPVFYLPYWNFPIDDRRQTGFLQPEFETSSTNGATFIAPFYWNIAPNYDATFRSQYMTKRSWKFDNTFRYLTSDSNGQIIFDFLPHDRGYQELRDQQYSNTAFMQSTDPGTAMRRNDLKPRDFRYGFKMVNDTRLTKCWSFVLDYTTAGDGNYFSDFTTDQYAKIYALQKGSLVYNGNIGNGRITAQQIQPFHAVNGASGAEQLSKFPELAYSSTMFDLGCNFNWSVTANYTNFRPYNIPFNNNPLSYGQRTQMRPALYYNLVEPGWFIKPRVQLNYVNYSDLTIMPANLAQGISQRRSNTFIPMYDVDNGLIFERSWRNEMVQTLEPRLYYLYVPSINQNDLPIFDSALMTFDYNQLFRDNRYTGLDRVSEANQVTCGLASRLFGDTGDEIAMIGIGQIYYIKNTIQTLDTAQKYTYTKWSPVAATASVRMAPDYMLTANWIHFRTMPDTFSIQLQYHPEVHRVINFGYEQAGNTNIDDTTGKYNSDVQQFNISAAWKITPPLRLLGRFNYDIRFQHSLNSLAGFEYHTCCTAIRFVWSRIWQTNTVTMQDYKNTFHIQLIFKGLGGVGNAEDRFLATTIPGYAP